MGSYVVKADDIAKVIQQITVLIPHTAKLEALKPLVDNIRQPEFRRIKWFFYCDDKQGNTIRVFDSSFDDKYRALFTKDRHVLLRGKNIGPENAKVKREILGLFTEVSKDVPPFVTYEGSRECFEYFEEKNRDSGTGDDHVIDNYVVEHPIEIQQRYQTLINQTFLDHDFFRSLETLLQTHRQVILEGPPGSR